jgi:hypothetical protein
MANQRRKAFNDELNLCLNKSLEKILPIIAKQTAEIIYNSISNILIESEKNIREIKNAIDTLRATLNSCNFLTKKSYDMNSMNKLYGNLNKVSGNLNNCGILLNNQIKFAQGNEEFKGQQQELINSVIQKFENIKNLLGKQKEYSGRLNECIKTSLANIIATKTNYKNELIKVQDNIRYDIINNGNTDYENNKNLSNRINDINITVNEFKNKVDSAENIYLNVNKNDINESNNNIVNHYGNDVQRQNGDFNQDMNNMNKENVNSMNQTLPQDINMNNTNNSINNCESNHTKANKLEKLFSQVNGGNFRF